MSLRTLRASLPGARRFAARHALRLAVVAASCIFAGGCAGTQSAPAATAGKPVCLVLSVGAQDGLAHIGVIEALKERGVEPECVFGNSMGALVGGLYASDPERDVRERYRSIARAYEKKSEEAVSGAAALGCILLGPLGCILAPAAVLERDRQRLVDILQQEFDGADIRDLPIPFATWHQRLQSSPELIASRKGDLADAINHSIGNPLIFQDVRVEPGARLDPGLDRVSAVPLEDACRLRPDAHFIVSNVTGRPAFVSKDMACSYTEIMVKVPSVELKGALLARGRAFDQVVEAGFDATQESLSPQSGKTAKRKRAPASRRTGGQYAARTDGEPARRD